MATYAFTDASLIDAHQDFSPYTTSLNVDITANTLDVTTFGDTFVNRIGGLTDITVGAATLIDDTFPNYGVDQFTRLGSVAGTRVVTISPSTIAEGNEAISFEALNADWQMGGTVGDRFEMPVTYSGRGDYVHGLCLEPGDTARTVTGTTTGVDFGAAPGTSATVYAALHVLAYGGTTPTLDVVIQSDESGFGSPTNRITFTQATAHTAEWKSATGWATDDWMRVSYTLGGTTPTFTFVVVAGFK